jgi:hypothetical protein
MVKPYFIGDRLCVPYLKNQNGVYVGWTILSVLNTKKWIEEHGVVD